MKVVMLGGEGRFDRSTGDGVPAYMYWIYNSMRKLEGRGLALSKIEYPRTSRFGDGAAWLRLVMKSAIDDYRGFDIVHTVDVKPFFPLNRGNAVYAATGHDFQPLTAPELDADLKTSAKNRIKLALEVRHSLRLSLKSDYLIAVSTMTRDDAISLGYDRKRIFVVNHGIDDRFRKLIRKRPNGGRFRVGYIGGFRTRKNVGSAINAFKKIGSRNIVFDIWGKPAYEYGRLVDLARDDSRIRFRGFAPEGRIVDIYDTFDVFVWPSMYEGFGFSILGAQARGLPVVAYRKSRIPMEVRKHCIEVEDEAGMADAIEGIRSNGYSAVKRKRAMAYARSFTWEKAASGTLDAYRRMLS
ncbi:MAG: glycosyltransferase [Candidatus Marsarchaeota archaeon]|nr:glycosyltransferase [Candidatus Marsarchaeota archaeon]